MPEPDPSQRPAATDAERTFERVVGVGALIGVIAAVVAGATIWLLLTDPVSVANAVESGQLSPLLLQLVAVIYDAVAALLEYL